jgi:hypothetical protein
MLSAVQTRPSSANEVRPSTSSGQTPTNLKLQAAIDKYGSFTNALKAVSSNDFADKISQLWSMFYDRCRYLDSRINPTGYLSWTEVKSVFSYMHIQKMATERCLRNLFRDLGK